jgi:rhodanese-related sulfurtransferase
MAIACGNIGILAQTAKDERIELYCRSGARSEQARILLLDLGFTNVTNIGGLNDAEKDPEKKK